MSTVEFNNRTFIKNCVIINALPPPYRSVAKFCVRKRRHKHQSTLMKPFAQ